VLAFAKVVEKRQFLMHVVPFDLSFTFTARVLDSNPTSHTSAASHNI
jgi:hypothetical protein